MPNKRFLRSIKTLCHLSYYRDKQRNRMIIRFLSFNIDLSYMLVNKTFLSEIYQMTRRYCN